jgi:hypothetical protein
MNSLFISLISHSGSKEAESTFSQEINWKDPKVKAEMIAAARREEITERTYQIQKGQAQGSTLSGNGRLPSREL